MIKESFKKWGLGLYSPFVKSDTIGRVSGFYMHEFRIWERGSDG